MFTMNTNTRLVLAFVVGIVSMIIIAGGLYLVLAGFSIAATLCGCYMLADGALTLVASIVYSFRQLQLRNADEIDDYDYQEDDENCDD